ncbi:MAG: AsmA family protein [Pseudomonadota bacterium]
MKRFVLVLVGLLAALAAVVVIVPSFFNWNSQKDLIEEQASAALGQPVSIAGDLSLSILPSPRLSAGGLKVGSRETLDAGPYISADLVDIRVAFKPLLSGKIEASSIILDAPKIVILTGQDDETAEAETASAAPDLALPEVLVSKGQLVFVEAKSGAETSISNINAKLAADSINGPFVIDGALSVEGQELDLLVKTGRIDTVDFPFDVKFSAPSAGALEASLVGTARDVLTTHPAASAQLSITSLDIGAAANRLSSADVAALAGQTLGIAGRVELTGTRVTLPDLALSLGDMRADLRGEATVSNGQTVATFNLSSNRIDLEPFLSTPDEANTRINKLEASLPENVKVTLTADIGAIDGLGVPMQNVRLAGRLSSKRLDVSLTELTLPGGVNATTDMTLEERNGQLTGPLRAQISGANAAPLLTALMGPDAALPPAPLPLNLQLDGAVETTQIWLKALVGALGETRINASANLAYGDDATASLKARLGRINLDDWIADGPASKAAADENAGSAVSGLLNADIEVAELARAGQTYEDVRIVTRVEGETATLETLSLGKAPGAVVSASGSVRNLSGDAPQLDLRFKASGANASQLLALAGQEPIESLDKAGKVSLSGTVSGSSEQPSIDAQGSIGDLSLKANAALAALSTEMPTVRGSLQAQSSNLGAMLARMELLDPSQGGRQAQAFSVESTFEMAGSAQTATVTGGTGSGQFNARYSNNGEQMSVDVNAKAADLTRFITSLGIAFDPAGARLGGLDTQVALSGPPQALTARTFNMMIGPARLTGSGRLDVSGPVTKVDFRLTGQNLDLAAILPEADTGAQQVASGTGQRWSKEPLDLAALESIDGVVTLDLDRLTWQTYELKNVRASVASEGKTLRIALDRALLFDGPASLAINLDGSSIPALSTELALNNANVEKATQSSAAIAPLTGTLNLNGQFSGKGVSEYDIVNTLNGSARFVVTDGMVNGIDIVSINERFGNLRTVADFVQIAGSALQGGQTHYETISVDLVARNGVLSTQNMRTQIDGGAQAGLNARIDLPEWQVQADGSFALADHPQAPPVGVSIRGRLDSPAITYETKAIQNYLGARFGAAVLRGVVKGDGFGFKDILGGGTPAEETPEETATQEPVATPEEKLRDLILDGFFGGKRKSSP